MTPSPADGPDVVALCSELIRIDTTNRGGADGANERPAAEWVAGLLTDAGLAPVLLESEPGRANVFARIAGTDATRPALLVHCHLDVVPAEPEDWRVHPLSGEVADGHVWGRGAVDMKDMCAMVLGVALRWHRSGIRPSRDIVLAFFADEETGSELGAHWSAREHPELFEGCSEAVGEVGGFSYTVNERLRLYPIMTAEKGNAWMRLTARGVAGHGSMLSADNAVVRLSEAVARLGRHRFPLRLTESVRGFLDAVQAALGGTALGGTALGGTALGGTALGGTGGLGVGGAADGVARVPAGMAMGIEDVGDGAGDLDALLGGLGPIAAMIGATLRNTANPSMLRAGSNINVIPQEAVAYADGRFLPGYEEEFHRQITEVLGDGIEWELVQRDIALQAPFDVPLVHTMADALRAEDPAAVAVPYMLSAGTDAKAFAPLGMRCYGFSPLRLPPDLDFSALFHGVDERVPVSGLQFGERVLDRFLRSA